MELNPSQIMILLTMGGTAIAALGFALWLKHHVEKDHHDKHKLQ